MNKREIKRSLIGSLFWLRDCAHLAHLSTSSYAVHKALEEFYTGLLPLIDEFAEIVQRFNLLDIDISGTNSRLTKDQRINICIEGVKQYILENEDAFTRAENNVLDDILSLMDVTLYKLNNLV